LAPADDVSSITNLSTSVSLAVLDRDGQEMNLTSASGGVPFEFIIPRDPNAPVASMVVQNVTMLSDDHRHALLYQLYHVSLNQSNGWPVSVHIDVRPLNVSVSYVVVYRFDGAPQVNRSMQVVDGWMMLCGSST
jgi:hypothetical protein